ncbi:hypothetical protein M407DRAFT_32730 [Tulasnella calospora MUT 4182]|uniref:F-box domain-containing protein n=1 Tax=Tulasnella calospora MUT 4182 TaxID=1051891 RepID=A0A0C3K855_9AGAM|nr:hypothetical protein M407DRAFT_32961 [Tulasnella calospora MUT 4182]KIO17603.1 hypothetical protein M407DRAFT_32730 [Tulasnella calospora MUT 4182]
MDEFYLQKVLSSIQIVFPTIERRVERQISQMRACREAAGRPFEARKDFNRTVPINQLHFEIFTRIVEGFLQDELFRSSYHQDLGRLRLVCSSWDARILQHPRVWSFIPAHYASINQEAVEKYLERSKSVPLSIWYYPDGHLDPPPILPQVILRACSRWRSINLTLEHTADFLPLANASVPQLEVLELTCFGAEDEEEEDRVESLNLFGGNAPRLRKVTIRELPLRWDAAIFRGLEELVVEDVYGIPLTHLTDILLQSPTLNTLHLHDCWIDDQQIAGLVPSHIIALPHLRSIHLERLSGNVTSCLLQHLSAPAVQELVIEPDPSVGDDPNALLQGAATFISHAGEMVSGLRYLQLNLHAMDDSGWIKLTASAHQDDRIFTLASALGRPVDWAGWVQDHILPALSENAEIDLVVGGTISNDLLSKSSYPQFVRSLEISTYKMPPETFEYLGRPVAAQDNFGPSSQHWPFSSVTRMTFVVDRLDLCALTNMLERRCGMWEPQTPASIPQNQNFNHQPQSGSELREGFSGGADNRANTSSYPTYPAPLQLLQLPSPSHPASSALATAFSRAEASIFLARIKRAVGDEVLKFEPCQLPM